MPSPRPQLFAPVARAVREALEAVASGPVREAVIASALRTSGRFAVPEAGPEVLEFAESALHRALSERLGSDVANEVLEQLRPVLERAATRISLCPSTSASSIPAHLPAAERSTRPAPAAASAPEPEEESGIYPSSHLPALTHPAPSASMPTVFLASRDPAMATALARALGGRATVRVIDGLLDLLEAIDEDADATRAVVIDATQPSVQVRSLLTVAPDLAGRTRVVVWRAAPDDHHAIVSAPASSSAGWIRCAESIDQLADACAATLA